MRKLQMFKITKNLQKLEISKKEVYNDKEHRLSVLIFFVLDTLLYI